MGVEAPSVTMQKLFYFDRITGVFLFVVLVFVCNGITTVYLLRTVFSLY